MLAAISSFLGGMFASSKMQDVAIDGIKKLGGLDAMTDQEKAEYLLKFMEATKHQSPMRRFIALFVTSLFGLNVLVWIVASVIGYSFEYEQAIQLSNAIHQYSDQVLATPFSLVLTFYFVTNIINKVGK